MNAHQKYTYLVFGRGLDLGALTLGSLLSDPANPQERSPYIYTISEADLLPWTDKPQEDVPCALHFTATPSWLAKLNLLGLIDGHSSRSSKYELKIDGKSGIRRQLIEPEKFLNERVLKSSDARQWLLSRLSVSRKQYYANRLKGQPPGIWMVSGIQSIEKGKVSLNNKSENASLFGFTIPLPDPTAAGTAFASLSSTGIAKIKGEVRGSTGTDNSYGYEDSRIWAAQFVQLRPKLRSEVASNDGVANSANWVKLRNLVHLGAKGVRADYDSDEEESELENLDEYTLLDGLGLEDHVSSEQMQKDIIDNTMSVDWTLFQDYAEQEEAKRKDEEEQTAREVKT